MKREVNFLQDYLVTLHQNLSEFSTKSYLPVGAVVREDFLDLSAKLEQQAFLFFEKDIRRLKLSSVRERHKYPREETEQRLTATRLLQDWDEIRGLGSSLDDMGVS